MSDNDQNETGEAYDKNRAKLAEDRDDDAGAVVTGTGSPLGVETLFPGAKDRLGAADATDGGTAARAAKGLDTGDVTVTDATWTAQSAQPYVSTNAQDVPGQTFTTAELPDAEVVDASPLPAHAIPEGLVVDAVDTDDINSSQEGGDVATAPQHAGDAPQAAKGGRAAGRKAGK